MKYLLLPLLYLFIIPLAFCDLSIRIYQMIYFSIHGIPKLKKADFYRKYTHDVDSTRISLNYFIFVYFYVTNKYIKALAAQTEIFSCAIKHWHPASNQAHQKNFYSARLFDEDTKNDPDGASTQEVIERTGNLIVQQDKNLVYRNFILDWIAIFAIFGMVLPILICDAMLIIIYHTYFPAAGLKSKVTRKKFVVVDRWRLPKLKFAHKLNCFYCEYANGLAAWFDRMVQVFGEDVGYLK